MHTHDCARTATFVVVTDAIVDVGRNTTTFISVHPDALAGGQKLAFKAQPWDNRHCGCVSNLIVHVLLDVV